MIVSISNYFIKYGYRQKDIEKAQILEEVCCEKITTRSWLYQKLSVRPNNVTDATNELINQGYLREGNMLNKRKKGRPEKALFPVTNRIVAIAVWVKSKSLVSAIINFDGKLEHSIKKKLREDISNKDFLTIFLFLQKKYNE